MTALPALLVPTIDETNPDPTYPSDWPGPGKIDLDLHDLPHASSSLEWWYLNCHLTTEDGRDVSLFVAFFRERISESSAPSGDVEYAHSVAWGLCEPAAGRYSAKVAVDSAAPLLGLRKLEQTANTTDPRHAHLKNALREVLVKNRIPGPTQLLNFQAEVDSSTLSLVYGGDSLQKTGPDRYELRLYDARTGLGCHLKFVPQKPATRYGQDGVVHGVGDELMFYYFIPRCEVTGSLVIDGQLAPVNRGQGWYDHEFGFVPRVKPTLRAVEKARDSHTAWRWMSLQLDNGTDLSVFIIHHPGTGEELDNWLIVVDPEGKRHAFANVQLRETASFRSTRSFVTYPIGFELEAPEAELELTVSAVMPDQEVLTVISDPGFWEGRVEARGSLGGQPFTAKGWVECKGSRFASVDGFLRAVGSEVRERLEQILPEQPTPASLQHCVVRAEDGLLSAPRYLEGVDPVAFAESLIHPISMIVERGGKAWRSYAALACIDVVGGDSRQFLHWLVVPELLHVGSLIIDDVEDHSELRRGGPACHVLFGEEIAINAGTAAYFLAEPPVFSDAIPPTDKLRIYRFYFDAMRAGHAGQALDLKGHGALTSRAVRDGDICELERSVLAVHRLKTAVPAGMLARIGAVLGGGSSAQVEGLGRYFEALGLAFQILDDVLNLRGFEKDLKQRGEDLLHGKVTLPIVKALGRLPLTGRSWLWRVLQSRGADPAQVMHALDVIESVGALDVCVAEARSGVEAAWAALDPLLEDSQFKLMFRAFSAYVLERHY